MGMITGLVLKSMAWKMENLCVDFVPRCVYASLLSRNYQLCLRDMGLNVDEDDIDHSNLMMMPLLIFKRKGNITIFGANKVCIITKDGI